MKLETCKELWLKETKTKTKQDIWNYITNENQNTVEGSINLSGIMSKPPLTSGQINKNLHATV